MALSDIGALLTALFQEPSFAGKVLSGNSEEDFRRQAYLAGMKPLADQRKARMLPQLLHNAEAGYSAYPDAEDLLTLLFGLQRGTFGTYDAMSPLDLKSARSNIKVRHDQRGR